MQRLTQNVCRSLRSVHHVLLHCILIAAVIGVELFFFASSPHAAPKYFPKRFILYGDIGLTYEEKWSSPSDLNIKRFTHNYNIGLSGFAIDPRLMTFDVETRISEEINKPEDNENLYGFSSTLNFFNKPARRGFFSHFPQPIQLSYSYYEASTSSNQNYGISFGYDFLESIRTHRRYQQQQQQQQQFRRQRQLNQASNENDGQESEENNGQQKQVSVQRQTPSRLKNINLLIPLPVLYVDYRNTSYSSTRGSQDFNIDSELLNLRLVDRATKTEYLAEYDYQNYKRDVDTTAQYLNVEVNYRDYLREEKRRFESYNRLYLTDFGDVRTLKLRNKNYWDKKLGTNLKDALTITGGGSYFTSDEESSSSSYAVNASTQFIKNFKRSWNKASANFAYGDTGDDIIYSVRLLDEANRDISRSLSLTGRAAVGTNELGEEYGVGASVWIRSFINMVPRYDFASIAASEGRTDTHDFGFDLSGRIYRAITFNSRNSYRIREVGGSNGFRDKVMSLREDVYMPLRRMNINIGASRIEARRTDSELDQGSSPVEIDVTSLYSNVSAPLGRGAFLTMNTTYTEDLIGEVFSIRPIINWTIRLLSVTAEYELRKTSGEKDVTDQRIFFRLIRTFSINMGGLW